jgi:DNA adenine methylase
VIETTQRLNNIAQRYDPGCQYEELLIANYDTTENARSIVQMTLFNQFEQTERLLKERKVIYEKPDENHSDPGRDV